MKTEGLNKTGRLALILRPQVTLVVVMGAPKLCIVIFRELCFV